MLRIAQVTIDTAYPDRLADFWVDAEVRRLANLGARELGTTRADGMVWTTVADPEGNEFDVVGA